MGEGYIADVHMYIHRRKCISIFLSQSVYLFCYISIILPCIKDEQEAQRCISDSVAVNSAKLVTSADISKFAEVQKIKPTET